MTQRSLLVTVAIVERFSPVPLRTEEGDAGDGGGGGLDGTAEDGGSYREKKIGEGQEGKAKKKKDRKRMKNKKVALK